MRNHSDGRFKNGKTASGMILLGKVLPAMLLTLDQD